MARADQLLAAMLTAMRREDELLATLLDDLQGEAEGRQDTQDTRQVWGQDRHRTVLVTSLHCPMY